MKRFLSLILALVLCLSLCACGGTQDTDGGEDLREITFVLDWTPNTNHTGLYVAQAKGWFEEAGLSVTIVQPPEDGAETMVAAGQAQFGVSFQDYLAPALCGDPVMPITAVAAVVQHNTSGILSRAGEGMDSPAGLEGKKYATWDLPVEQATIRHVMEKDGGDFDKVELIPSTVTDEVTALQSGQIDAVWVYYGWAGINAEIQGLETDYFDFGEIAPELDYYTPVIIANNSLLEEEPEVAKAFLSALQKGYAFAVENPDAAADILLEAAPELDSELVHASQKWLSEQYQADAERWGYIDPARWNAFYAWMNENGLAETELPMDVGFTNDYLPE